jgi:hypothetical protein
LFQKTKLFPAFKNEPGSLFKYNLPFFFNPGNHNDFDHRYFYLSQQFGVFGSLNINNANFTKIVKLPEGFSPMKYHNFFLTTDRKMILCVLYNNEKYPNGQFFNEKPLVYSIEKNSIVKIIDLNKQTIGKTVKWNLGFNFVFKNYVVLFRNQTFKGRMYRILKIVNILNMKKPAKYFTVPFH